MVLRRKALGGIRACDLYLTKVTLYQAILLPPFVAAATLQLLLRRDVQLFPYAITKVSLLSITKLLWLI